MKTLNPHKIRVTVGLLVTTKQEQGYFHVSAYPVTIGPNAWEQRSRIDGSFAYPDIHSRTIRNASDDLVNGLDLNNLLAYSQGHDEAADRKLYGWEVRYHNVYTVDLRKAERMTKTLRTVEKRMEKLTASYGHPATYGAYLARVARAIGATTFVFHKDGGRTGWCHSETEYTFRDTNAEAISEVDRIVQTWVSANKSEAMSA